MSANRLGKEKKNKVKKLRAATPLRTHISLLQLLLLFYHSLTAFLDLKSLRSR